MAIGHQLLAGATLLVARLSPARTNADARSQPPHAEGGEKTVVATGGCESRTRRSRRVGWSELIAGAASASCRNSSGRGPSLLAHAVRRPHRVVSYTAPAVAGTRARHGLE